MSTERLTAEQVYSVNAAVLVGHHLDDFAARHPDWPQADLRATWLSIAAEVAATELPPGGYWAVPSEW